jgi:serine/threonine-protein kinase
MQGDSSLPALGPGALVAEKYRLEKELGRGAMGAVFSATTLTGERVAVKTLFRIVGGNATPEERARFLREASVSRSLKGEHIVRVHDHGFDPETGTPFMVMDLLQGEDLEAAITRLGPLSPQLAVTIVLQACRALEASHRAGVVHRDIKSSNIFLHDDGGVITTKVCDFGIAKVLDQDSLTATGSVMGSPLFMAPEQFRDAKNVDERTDVWSIGMTLYHALAGRPAFYQLETFAQLVVAITGASPIPPLQSLAPWVPSELAATVHGALIHDRGMRCPTVREFATAIAAIVAPLPKLSRDDFVPLPPEELVRRASLAPSRATWAELAPTGQSISDFETTDPLLGQLLADRYRLHRVLGRGGMGAVYEATTPGGESFAVKVIRPDLGEHKGREAIRRFVREAKASQGIDSPYVARIVDAGADEARGVPYLAMELLRGRDLGAVIKDNGPLEPDTILPAFVQACAGIGAAHARGIVHRDIKPANIFLHESKDGEVVAKVCDFGVAKQIVQVEEGTELTRTGGMLGSPMYMSPEQAQNAKNVDQRSDVWSLGVTLYEALTGMKAWEGSTMGELILAICTRDLQPVLELAPWVRPELADVVHRATRRAPGERYASADEMAAALRPLVSSPSMTMSTIRGVSPERRRTAIAARSSAKMQWTSDSTAQPTSTSSVASVAAPKRRAPLVAGIVIAGALVSAAAVQMLRQRTHESPPAPATPVVAGAASSVPPVVTLTPPVDTPTPATSGSAAVASASSGPSPPPPVVAAAGGGKKPVVPGPPAPGSASKPPPAAAPSFKTTW